MVYNILNGDSLAHSFPDAKIEGDVIIVREGLIDGNLSGDNLHNFWQSRAEYMGLAEVGYDLFCQVNMWFVISIINSLPIRKEVYVVHTSYLARTSKQFWNGFGPANSGELTICFADRVPLNITDLQLGQDLWTAYKSGDLAELICLAEKQSSAFPYLQEVIKAHVDRFPKDGKKGRPERVMEDIIEMFWQTFIKYLKNFGKEKLYTALVIFN